MSGHPSFTQSFHMRRVVAQLVERLTGDGRVASLRLIGVTVLCPGANTLSLLSTGLLVQSRKTRNCSDMTEEFLTGT